MAVDDAELKVIFDGVWQSSVGSVAIFNALVQALSAQPGINAAMLACDLDAKLDRYLELFGDPSLTRQTIEAAKEMLDASGA